MGDAMITITALGAFTIPVQLHRLIDFTSGPCPLMGIPPYTEDGYRRYGNSTLHRALWMANYGTIPAGLVLDHVAALGCTSRACCYPPHLEPVTPRENVLRGTSFAAVNARKDRCDNGHDYDLLNTYWKPDGGRDCRKCIARRVREYQKRQRAVWRPAAA